MFAKSALRISSRSIVARRGIQTTRVAKTEGAINTSRGGFSDKEKAVENQWAYTHDAEKLKKLRETLALTEKHTAELKKHLDEFEQSIVKK
ncbi:hypothetical protein J3Q64DRAFT_1767932 [Phycomyces blakesleeanus]|uniref:ATPase inhibitor, mitochondrial n=2 Tax=Phycomyces blakesleeanus TaxID=4837 RepID=A0A162W8R9_PHYB8|nr:hypothetical protein PHYBLDRAFT_184159 [Phycomyces blakesleeanus NRRL 1555(-)]OAD65415.1 hypothetical protein PHYBLDRAFT_184159 [Phycomyces blakesleeanus NRRL 1555(-)]|eukprot:XP_018283455.1 hypothetical protein PHYBLDRAFT_184159 [Phycomyces blakesleeanus NRRL 1555(-)]